MNLVLEFIIFMYKFTEADLVPDTGKPATEEEFDLIRGYITGMEGHWPDSLIEDLVDTVWAYEATQKGVSA